MIVREIAGPDDLGRIFFFAEFAIATAGWVLGINPFDQPNVQEAKDATSRVLAEGAEDQPDATDDELRALLGGLGAPSYLAVMGYVEPSADFDAAVSELRQVDPRRHAVGDDVRLRAALPALDRPAAQGRPADRALPAARARLGARRRDPRAPTTASRASSTRRRSATSRRCARTTCPPQRVTLEGDDPAAALRALTERLKGLL